MKVAVKIKDAENILKQIEEAEQKLKEVRDILHGIVVCTEIEVGEK